MSHSWYPNPSPPPSTRKILCFFLRKCILSSLNSSITIAWKSLSVADPWDFGVDPDPDPRIHAADQGIRIRILDPDPSIFVIDLQDASKKLIFNTIFSAYDFLKQHLHHFSKIKIQKESQNRRNQGFSYYFSMMIEGSGSGSIPLTSGSGSWRPKNTWIRWIRIRNTEIPTYFFLFTLLQSETLCSTLPL